MDTAMLVLIILAIIYVPIWVWVWRKPEQAAKYHLVKYGPTVMIKTTLGIKTMDKLGKYKRFWRVFGFTSKVISAILFFLMMYMLIVAIIALPSRIGSGGIGIQYALAIPGFNPMLPLTYGILALFIAMVVHEMGHGIQSRANDCDVDSTGLLYGVVPLGAFCEPNEAQLKELPRRGQMDVYAAGITVNTFLAAITFAIMLIIVSSVSVADFGQTDASDLPGVYYIDEDSPAYVSGIPTSALILGIKEVGEDEFHDVIVKSNSRCVSFDYADPNQKISPLNTYILKYAIGPDADDIKESQVAIQMGALIKTVSNNSPAKSADLEPLTFLYSITLTHGETTTETFFSNAYDFLTYMSTTSAGDLATVKTVTISAEGDMEIVTHDQVTLTSSGSQGYLGISVTDSGFTVTTPTKMIENSVNPFNGASAPIDYVQGLFKYLSGPFNGLDPVPNAITWWYDASDFTWIIVKTLYWIFWLDILLAISNALPAYPFDGGFLFEGGINWLLEKLGVKDAEKRKKMSGSASGAVSTVVLLMFGLVLLTFII